MKRLRIAVQNSGRLSHGSLEYLRSIGLSFQPNGRSLISPCGNFNADILHLRDDDIPEYVGRSVADFGIVGENVLLEKKVRVNLVKKLGFGRCSLVIAVPEDSPIQSVSDLEGERIATAYPRLLFDFLKEKEIRSAIIPIRGSVEVTPSLNLADAVCDLMQTGKTLQDHNLKALVTILESQAVLVESPITKEEKEPFLQLCRASSTAIEEKGKRSK